MVEPTAQNFADLLTLAVHRIKRRESKPIAVIQDELGYALGREGGSVIEYWRKGNLPPKQRDVEQLATLLMERGALPRDWLEEFLRTAGYGAGTEAFADRVFGEGGAPHRPAAEGGDGHAPFQAPRRLPHFVGRRPELLALSAGLRSGVPPGICALVGMGGAGKTTLATQVAHALRSQFADGVLWASAATGDAGDIAAQWAGAFGYELSGVDDSQNRAAALRGLLAERKVLIVLDDVQQISDVQALLPNGDHCAVLITTRNEEVAIALSAQIVRLGELLPQEGLDLLASIIGEDRLAGEIDAAREICGHLRCLPLALEILGQLLAARPGRRLGDMAVHLRDLENRLQLRISDRAVRTSFAASWEFLDEEQRETFVSLGAFAGRSFPVDALAYLLNQSPFLAEERLYSLRALSLVTEEGEGRYRQHPLLAGFAGEKLGSSTATYLRLADYYARFALAHSEDLATLQREQEGLFAGMQVAHRYGAGALVLQFAAALTEVWFRGGLFHQARQGYAWAWAAASHQGDGGVRALIRENWGRACLEQDDYAEAQEHLLFSRDLYQDLGSAAGLARSHYWLARLGLERSDYAGSQEHLEICHACCEESGNEAGLARVYYQQAFIAYDVGELEQARRLCRQAEVIQERLPDRADLVPTLRLLVDIALEREEPDEAERLCRRALALAEELNHRSEVAAVYYCMAVVARYQNRLALAAVHAQEALELFRTMGDRGFQALTLYEQSRICGLNRDRARARALAEESIALFRQVHEHYNLIYVLRHLGHLHRDAGRLPEAHACWQEALQLAQAQGHPLAAELAQCLTDGAAGETDDREGNAGATPPSR